MGSTVIGCFNEAEEFIRYVEMLIEDEQAAIDVAKGHQLSNENHWLEIDKLIEKYKEDYDRMFRIIDRLGLVGSLTDIVSEDTAPNYDYSSEYENFFYDATEQMIGFLPIGVDSKVYMVIRSEPNGKTYYYINAKPREVTDIMSNESDSEMTITKTGNNYKFEAGETILQFIDIGKKLSKIIKQEKKELMSANKMEIEYLGIKPDISREELITELVVNGVIDPYYEKNRKKGIYFIS